MGLVFPNMVEHYSNQQWLCERAILAPKNDALAIINTQLLQQVPGDVTLYKSVDSAPDISGVVQYPVEFLNSLELSGVPPHMLQLKIGAPIMLRRNLDPQKLCNGTRMAV